MTTNYNRFDFIVRAVEGVWKMRQNPQRIEYIEDMLPSMQVLRNASQVVLEGAISAFE